MKYSSFSLMLLTGALMFLPGSISSAADTNPAVPPTPASQADTPVKNLNERIANRIAECYLEEPAAAISTGVAAFDDNVVVGGSATAQLLRFNLRSGKASVNSPGVGVGVAFRYYPKGWISIPKGKTKDIPGLISHIRSDCRATTFDAATLEDNPEKAKVAFSLFSISPTVFVSKEEKTSDVTVQPALVVSLLRDIVSFGVGINTTKPDRGKAFLLLGLGAGFRF